MVASFYLRLKCNRITLKGALSRSTLFNHSFLRQTATVEAITPESGWAEDILPNRTRRYMQPRRWRSVSSCNLKKNFKKKPFVAGLLNKLKHIGLRSGDQCKARYKRCFYSQVKLAQANTPRAPISPSVALYLFLLLF